MSAAADWSGTDDVAPAMISLAAETPDAREIHPLRYEVKAVSIPADEFTGDFFYTTMSGDTFWLAVGDVAGKGLGAAVFMAMIQEELERAIHSGADPDVIEVVSSIHHVLREELPRNRFATLVIGKLGPDGLLRLVNAGHCLPLILRQNGLVEKFRSNGPAVGILDRSSWIEETIELQPGDVLVVYTDGLLEASASNDEEFGLDRIVDVARTERTLHVVDRLVDEAMRFTNGARQDDLTVFALAAD